MKKQLRTLNSILVACLTAMIVYFISEYYSVDRADTPIEPQVVEKDTIISPEEFGINLSTYKVEKAKLKPNEFLANILLPNGVNYVTIDQLAKQSKEVFDVRRMKAGDQYTLLSTKDSIPKLDYFIYQLDPINYITYDLRDSIVITKGAKEVKIEEKTIAGVINSSLYESLQESGGNPALAVELSEIFAWSIDFYRIQKGDWFKAIYEVQYVDNEAIGIGRILAVEFKHFDKNFLGFYFDQGGKTDYFDEEANSLRKAFLKSPLKFSRLSSRFTMRRFHPVQKRWKAHLGTDYAAPRGTPIMSTGDGVVVAASYTKGNGKYVKIKHNSVYTTQYLHMSRRNVKNGQFVKQGDIIGYVGSTGLATGPHVCYRFWKNGSQVDHLRQDFPSAEPVQKDFKTEFEQNKEQLMKRLNEIELEKQLIAQH